MRQFFQRRSVSLVVGVLTLLLLVFLAAGVDSLEFKKGIDFAYVQEQVEESTGSAELPDMNWLFVIVVSFLVFLTILVILLAPPKQRRIILLALLFLALTLLGVMWWISREAGPQLPVPTPTPGSTMVTQDLNSVPQAQETPVLYQPPKVSPWISIAITFAVLLVFAILVWLFLRYRLRVSAPLPELAGIAEQAIIDLQAGKDYGDAILNCYARMMDVLNRQRGIRRRGNLTPAEFIAVLDRARLPSASVRQLTALFERVRYGGKNPSPKEIDEAVTCLNEIVTACRGVQ